MDEMDIMDDIDRKSPGEPGFLFEGKIGVIRRG